MQDLSASLFSANPYEIWSVFCPLGENAHLGQVLQIPGVALQMRFSFIPRFVKVHNNDGVGKAFKLQ